MRLKKIITGLLGVMMLLLAVNVGIILAQAAEITATQEDDYRYSIDLADAGGADTTVKFDMNIAAGSGDQPVSMVINNSSGERYRLESYSISIIGIDFTIEEESFEFYNKSLQSYGLKSLDEYNNKGGDPDFLKEYLFEFIDENGVELVFNDTLAGVQGNPYGAYTFNYLIELNLSFDSLDESTTQEETTTESSVDITPETGHTGVTSAVLLSVLALGIWAFAKRKQA